MQACNAEHSAAAFAAAADGAHACDPLSSGTNATEEESTMNLAFSPMNLGFAAGGDGYCGTPYPHFPFPHGGVAVNPGVVIQPGVQQGIIIIGG